MILDASSALGRIELAERHRGGADRMGRGFRWPCVGASPVIRKAARWRAPYPVDDYRGSVAGMPDVPAIHATAVALVPGCARGRVGERQRALIDRLRSEIAEQIPEVDIAGDPVRRVPHLLTFSALYVDGETLTLELDKAGFAVASGSACSASSEHPSHVLAAMGALTHGNVRIGLAWTTVAEQVDRFLGVLPPIVAELRSRVGVS